MYVVGTYYVPKKTNYIWFYRELNDAAKIMKKLVSLPQSLENYSKCSTHKFVNKFKKKMSFSVDFLSKGFMYLKKN